jgi:outer membrane protein assembly factor BamB
MMMTQTQNCPRSLRRLPALLLVLAIAIGCAPRASQAGEWPSWRGPEQSGFSRETGLPGTWSRGDGKNGGTKNLLWTQSIGARSAPVVWDDRVYILHLTGDKKTWSEEVVCLDVNTGKIRWRYAFSLFLTDIPTTRVGWSNPCVDTETGNVYVHGVQGMFVCIDKDGNRVWERSLTEEFGRISGYGGRTHTPVVDEDRVVISFLNSAWSNQSRGTHRYLALDKHTGEVVWWSEPAGAPLDTTYSTPVIAILDGVRALIAGNADGNIYALKSRTGEKIWSFRLSKRGINVSVVYKDGLVYACHSEENQLNTDPAKPAMGRVVCFRASGKGDITETNEVWRHDALTAGYSSPACDDKLLYVGDNSANIHCFDLKTGKQHWEHNVGTVLKASPIVADGKLYIGEVSGHFTILGLKGTGRPELLSKERFAFDDGRPQEINGSPCVSNGKVIFTTFQNVYCLSKPNATGGSARVPRLPKEPAVDPNAKATHLQIVPAEVALTPASSCFFRARLFDESGRLLRECKPSWTLKGVKANIDAAGRLGIPADSGFQGGLLSASIDGLTANARVRVVPAMPLKVDFEDLPVGSSPPGWIAATKIKFQVTEIDGTKALKKLSKNSKFILARAYLGLATAKGYTMQVDVMGTEQKFQMPEIGIFNSRYRFELRGNSQKARIVAWAPAPRLEVTKRFRWDPKVWYTLKLRVDIKDGKGLVQAKAWKKSDPEPAEWLLEAEDPNPNLNGAPGLYGYSAGSTEKKIGAEIFYDNIVVSPNS